MNFLVDAQLPVALARWLEDHGQVAKHVHDVGLHRATDTTIWASALTADSIIVTKDEDFAQRRARVTLGPTVVWLRCGNLRRPALIDWFGTRWPTILTHLEGGDGLIEVR